MKIKILRYIGCLLTFLLLAGSLKPSEVNAQTLTWHSFEEALTLADTTDRPVLVDVSAPWCGWCHKLKQEVYPSLESDLRDRFVLTRINRDDHEKVYHYKGEKMTSHRLAQRLNATTVPTIVFLTTSGNYLLHLSGFVKTEELRPVLEYVSSKAYRHQTFRAFMD